MSIDLTLPPIGSMEIVRAEWWDQTSRFVLLRYTLNGTLIPLGLRMDMDKRAILDDVDDPDLNEKVQKRRIEIWQAVVDQRQ